jgi:hypothetical protein
MDLRMYDSSTESRQSLVAASHDIRSDAEAEDDVRESIERPEIGNVVKWVLSDDQGLLWERPVGSTDLPKVTQRSSCFNGAWETGPNEVAI